MSNYLCVFHACWLNNELKDVGDDPCFDNVPTWGICRPNSRKSVAIGDRLFFVGYVKAEDKYYVKGWFEVGEKLSYDEALARFPDRANVIISNVQRERVSRWRYPKLKRYFEECGQRDLTFLKNIVSQEGVFYQNPIDDHEIDNWKCRRIFHCRSSKFRNCVDAGRCQLDGISLKLEPFLNYVVAEPTKWAECGKLKIEFDELRTVTGFSKSLKTPKGQHNVLSLSDSEMSAMIAYPTRRVQG